MPDFKIAPTVNGVAIVRADGSVPMSGDLHLDSTLTLSHGTQDWVVQGDGNHVALQSNTPGTSAAFRLYTKDGDGTDTVEFEVFGKGLPGAIVNRERLLLGWAAAGNFYMSSENAGTGTLRPLWIYTGADTDQLVLAIDGKIGVQIAAPTGQLEVVGTAVTGETLKASRNLASASTDSSVVLIINDHAGDDQYALQGRQDAPKAVDFMERVTAGVAGILAVSEVKLTSTADIIDGFGPALVFKAQDALGSEGTLGWIGAVRSGADNTGDVVVYTTLAGALNLSLVITDGQRTGVNTAVPTATLQATQTQVTGEALRVTRDLVAASTDSPLVNFIQNNATDDQVALRVQQNAPVNIAEFYDGTVLSWVFADGGLAGNVVGPLAQIDISTDGTATDRGLMVEQHSLNTASAPIYFRKSRGTRALPTITGNTDFIGSFAASVYDGSAYIIPGGFAFKVGGAVSAGVVPLDIIFSTASVNDASFTNVRLTITSTGDIVFAEGSDLVVGTVTGTKIGTLATQKIGFFGATPIIKPTAYTQTFATADKTHAARTSVAVTNSTGGVVSTTLAAITAGTTYLQADLTAIKNALASLADQHNKLVADLADTAQLTNSIVDDLQALGLVA